MIQLPPGIAFEKQNLGADRWAYVCRHEAMGTLGRIVTMPNPSGEGTLVSCEVAGDPADPMTSERRMVFEPIGIEIAEALAERTGAPPKGDGELGISLPPVSSAPSPSRAMTYRLLQCARCGEPVALLIDAPDAVGPAEFEDQARLMYPEYVRHDLPTWIVGPELDGGGGMLADTMMVWPERGPIERLLLEPFNARIEELRARHCG